jgi:hypothetical protein
VCALQGLVSTLFINAWQSQFTSNVSVTNNGSEGAMLDCFRRAYLCAEVSENRIILLEY